MEENKKKNEQQEDILSSLAAPKKNVQEEPVQIVERKEVKKDSNNLKEIEELANIIIGSDNGLRKKKD